MSDTRPQTTASMVGMVLGNYRVISELSSGGMGMVFRAEHQLLGRPAAVKVLRPELTANQELLQRFFNEAKAATTIHHPGIVEVYDFGYTDDGRAYIVMELLDGEPLGERIKRGRLTEVETETIGRQIAGALRAAHGSGIVHRDLKPDNVFLVPDPDNHGVRAKVLDFGIAKLVDVSPTSVRHTQTGALMGTPLYMAPEQARAAGAIDHRADLYSLGCILYEMLVGQPPFVAEGAGEIIALQLFAAPEPPRNFLAALTPELDAIVLRLLEKEPQNRYQHAFEVLEALEGIRDRLSNKLADPVARDSKRFTLSMSTGPTEPGPILPTPRPSHDRSLRFGLLDGQPELRAERRSAMPIMAGLVTVALAAAGAIFVMTRDSGEPPAKPVPAAPASAPLPAPAPPVAVPAAVPPDSKDPGPAPVVVVDDPTETKPKPRPRPRTETPRPPAHDGLVTSPHSSSPCVTPKGYPCEDDVGHLTRPKPIAGSPATEAPQKEP